MQCGFQSSFSFVNPLTYARLPILHSTRHVPPLYHPIGNRTVGMSKELSEKTKEGRKEATISLSDVSAYLPSRSSCITTLKTIGFLLLIAGVGAAVATGTAAAANNANNQNGVVPTNGDSAPSPVYEPPAMPSETVQQTIANMNGGCPVRVPAGQAVRVADLPADQQAFIYANMDTGGIDDLKNRLWRLYKLDTPNGDKTAFAKIAPMMFQKGAERIQSMEKVYEMVCFSVVIGGAKDSENDDLRSVISNMRVMLAEDRAAEVLGHPMEPSNPVDMEAFLLLYNIYDNDQKSALGRLKTLKGKNPQGRPKIVDEALSAARFKHGMTDLTIESSSKDSPITIKKTKIDNTRLINRINRAFP